jgi:hypothetical protein
MPRPGANETHNKFMARCVPEVIDEGYTQDQAVGRCNGYWNTYKIDDAVKAGKEHFGDGFKGVIFKNMGPEDYGGK